MVSATILGFCVALSVRAPVANAAAKYDEAPPGTVVKEQPVYLRGEAMNSRYMVVASRLAINTTQSQYQPYLSIYAQSSAGSQSYKLVYRSPGPRDRLRIVPHMRIPPGSRVAFPQTSLSLVGAAEFMQPAVQQLVVSVHTESADCGATNVYVLDMNSGGLVKRAAFRNSCSLSAHIESGMPDAPASLALQGPYYAADAALCCPTRSHVRATAKWTAGAWRVTPSYFAALATSDSASDDSSSERLERIAVVDDCGIGML